MSFPRTQSINRSIPFLPFIKKEGYLRFLRKKPSDLGRAAFSAGISSFPMLILINQVKKKNKLRKALNFQSERFTLSLNPNMTM
jgi:hypothetical protein